MFIEIILIFFLEFAMFKLCKDWLLGIFKKIFKKKHTILKQRCPALVLL